MKRAASITKNRFKFEMISPFLLLAIFLIFFWVYTIIHTKANLGVDKIIMLPFIIVNMVYIDVALSTYFKSKNRLLVWCAESLISALIIFWFI
jgi:hypothetical protein